MRHSNGKLYSTGGSRRAVVALDGATGELLWMHSEELNGKQYVVIAISGGAYSGELLAFRLPN